MLLDTKMYSNIEHLECMECYGLLVFYFTEKFFLLYSSRFLFFLSLDIKDSIQ